jgi:peptidoglycan/xylan/chitin deacetylase (PgdA/CDA1 family)
MSRYIIKRNFLRATGILEYLWQTIKPGLYVFNYHRIGNPADSPFDPNVFSCDQEHFAKQVAAIQSRFKVINSQELIYLLAQGKAPTEPLAMITFDDGYRDNYELAFPVLKAAKTSGVFFLPTSYIGSKFIPWWDEAAWLIKNSKNEVLQVPTWSEVVVIDRQNLWRTVRSTLNNIKRDANTPLAEKLAQIRAACGCEMPPDAGAKLFMSWDEAREMSQGGMDIGSHAHSHEILSHLSVEQQRGELTRSKAILETQLNKTIDILAYPVGGRKSYTADTCKLAEECGYKVAFTFVYGFNPQPSNSPYQLLRIPVEDNCEPYDLKYAAVFARAQ